MNLPEQDIDHLLEKYHRNEASAEERLLLEQWYEQLDVTREEARLSAAQELRIKAEIYAGVTASLGQDITGITPPATPVKRMLAAVWWSKVSRVAAILLLIAGSAWLVYSVWKKQPVVVSTNPEKNVDSTQWKQKQETIPVAGLTARTGRVGRKRTVLPDGSVAWLNARSELKYPAQFSGNSRHVYVEQGEVFFSVVKDAAHPFIVHTGSVTTTVLGTSFVVKQSFEKNTLEIIVKTGKVKVEKFNKSGAHALVARDLLPSDQLSFDTTANAYRLKQVSVKGIAAFTEGKLFYDDSRLEEIVYDIGRKYNITIDFDNDQLKQCRYRISFDDITLDDCLQVLSVLTNTRIEKTGVRRYMIKGAACN